MTTHMACAECGATFTPRVHNQRFCSHACKVANENARRRQARASLEDRSVAVLARRVHHLEAQLEAAKANLRVREGALKSAQEELERLRQTLTLYEGEYTVAPEWLAPPRDDGEHHATLVAILSDVHAGEVVDPAEVGGVNAYNLDICEIRLRAFADRTCLLARNYLAGVTYDGIVLVLAGDLVSGDIHDELRETNECSTYEATEFLAPRVSAIVEQFAAEFGRVHVVSTPGNHGRDSRKPRAKRRSAHNADTHVARLAAMLARERGVEATWDIPRAFDATFKVYDYVFAVEHGDNLRFSGTSEIGALGPLKRGSLRKTNQMFLENNPPHYNLFGHFHQYIPATGQGFVCNGAVKGYDEYARTWHMRPESAQQALLVVTPEHGVTVQAPVIVQRRREEGW